MLERYLVSTYLWLPNNWASVNYKYWTLFGLSNEIQSPNIFFILTLDSLLKDKIADDEKVLEIYKYVRNNFRLIDTGDKDVKITDLKSLWDGRVGGSAQINLLLTAMLHKAKLKANYVAIATTSELPFTEQIPVDERINYFVCAARVNNTELLLDASDKYNIAGVLPSKCYNGFAWAMGEEGYGLVLDPMLCQNKDRYYTRIYDFHDSTAKVEIRAKPGLISSAKLRKSFAHDKDAEANYIKQQKSKLPAGVELISISLENKEDADAELVVKISGRLHVDTKKDVITIDQNFSGFFKSNPFPDVVRKLPVEFTMRADYISSLSIELPANFSPDSTFEPLNTTFDSTVIYQRGVNYMPESKIITVTASYSMGRKKFEAAEYQKLRDFFEKIVADNARALVFRRGKN